MMDKKEQELKEAIGRLAKIEKRIEDLPMEIIETVKRQKECQWSLEQKLQEIEELRKQRQKLLATGQSDGGITPQIERRWKEIDLKEDEIMGLKALEKEQRDEETRLPNERKVIIDDIFRISVDGLIDEVNVGFEVVSESVKKTHALAEKWGISFDPNALGKFFMVSTWGSFWIIPRLARSGEAAPKDFFSSSEIAEKKQREQLENIYRKAGLLK